MTGASPGTGTRAGAGAGGADPGDDASEHGSLGRASLLNLVGFGVYGVANFALVVVITRSLGPSGAGALLQAIAVFSILSRSAMAGTDIALVRFTSRFLARDRHAEVGTLFRIALLPVLAISGTAGLALFVLAHPLGELLSSGGGADELTRYFQVLAPFVPVACVYQVLEGGSRGFGTMAPSVVIERIGRSSLLPVAVLAVVAAGGGATAVGVAWAGPFALALVPMALWVTALLRRAERALAGRVGSPGAAGPAPAGAAADLDEVVADAPGVLVAEAPTPGTVPPTDGPEAGGALPPAVAGGGAGSATTEPAAPPAPIDRRELTRRFWRFALPRSLAGVFALAMTWVDALMLGAMEGNEAVGVYTAAIRWLLVGNFAGNAVTLAFAPRISAVMAREGAEGARRLFQGATAWLVLLAWPPYLVAIAFAPFLLGAFGSEFSTGTAGADGAAVIAITGAGFLLSTAAGPIDMLLLMAGRSRLSLINSGVALAVNVGLNLLLIPMMGIRGAAWSWLAAMVVANGLPLVQMWWLLRVQPLGRRSGRALVLGLGVAGALLAARGLLGASPGGLAVGVAAGAAVLVVGVLLTPDRLGVDEVLRRTPR